MVKEKAKVSDLTVEELKGLIERVVEAKLEDFFGDPDIGLTLRPEVEAYLKRSLAAVKRGQRGIPAEKVFKELELKQ